MAILTGNGFYLTTALGSGGAAAEGTVLSAVDLGQILDMQTDASLAGNSNQMHAGDSFIVDTDDDGDFSDETATTQTDNDRYTGSIVTYADGSTSTVVLELVTLSDGTQSIVVNDAGASNINAAAGEIQSITLGTFSTVHDNRFNQANFSNDISNTIVCFCETTYVRTPRGEKMIKTLQAGDEVVTSENGVQKVAWIGRRKLSTAELVASPHLKPVRIPAGALGEGSPRADLVVSPQHRILIVSKIAQRMFGKKEILVPAIKLVGTANIEQVTSVAPVTYTHLLFETHQIIFANGALAESLYTGPQAMQSLPEKSRGEIFEIFPELRRSGESAPTAHLTVQNRALVNQLLARHEKNHKPLVLSGPE